jgi:TRAP-type C4-dicarboxylate transport system substrate-binding protein
VEVIHGGALAGLRKSYDVVESGVADISDFVGQDVEKQFPLTNVPGLPFRYALSELYTKSWVNNVYKKGYLDQEYKDVKILFQFTTMGMKFLSAKPINNLSDLKGLKVIIGAGPAPVKLTKAWGAVGVFGPPPEIYMMLQKGIAESLIMPAFGLAEFHWDEFINYIIEPLSVSTVVHTVAMNKNTYKKLPDDVKDILEDMNKDAQYSIKMAVAFDKVNEHFLEEWLKTKGKKITWSEEEVAKLEKTVAPIWEEWIKVQEAKGLPAGKVVEAYCKGLQALGVENPALGYTTND